MSDQEDFFFDEEEQPTEPKKAPAQRSKAAVTETAAPSSATSFTTQTVTMSVAGLIAVCALLIGVIIGILVGGTDVVPSPTATTGGTGTGTGTQQAAPQLTDEQIKAGALPEGHPTIPSSGATSTAPAK